MAHLAHTFPVFALVVLATLQVLVADPPIRDAGCIHFENESDQGPVKASQEDPGVFVGVPINTPYRDEAGGDAVDLGGGGGAYSGVGVFYRNRDCELPTDQYLV